VSCEKRLKLLGVSTSPVLPDTCTPIKTGPEIPLYVIAEAGMEVHVLIDTLRRAAGTCEAPEHSDYQSRQFYVLRRK
jgi:hypothetical protein